MDIYFVSSLLKGIKRVKGDGHVQKLPVTIDILSRIFNVLNFRSSFDSSFWTICLTAFFGMLCKSDLLPTSANRFTSDKQFCKLDSQFFSCGVLVHVRCSKTIQFQDRKVGIPFSYILSSHLCHVKAIFCMSFPLLGLAAIVIRPLLSWMWTLVLLKPLPAPPSYPIYALASAMLVLSLSSMQRTRFVVGVQVLLMKLDCLLT